MALINNAQWDAFIASRSAYLDSVMVDEGERRPRTYPEIFEVRQSTKFREEFRTVSGIGLARQIPDQIPDQWPYDDMHPRFYKGFEHTWWGLGMQLSKPFMKWEMDGIGSAKGRELMGAGLDTHEYLAAQMLLGMTDATNYPVNDGKALAAADHPLDRPVIGTDTVFDNWVNADFGLASLTEALMTAFNMVDDRGRPLQYTPDLLIINPTLLTDALEIVQTIGMPYTGDNTINVVNTNWNLRIVVWNWIKSPTFWALRCTKHPLKFFMNQGVQQRVTEDFGNYSVKAQIDTFFTLGADEWRGFVGGKL